MNIFVREVKANLKSLLIWGVIVILFVTIGISKFSAYYENPEMMTILDNMPQAILTAFNFQAFNLTTVSGFFGVMFTYYALLLSIAATMWGSDTISKEERDKTVEFSLTLPVTRGRVVTAKSLAALVNCVGLLLITWGASVVGASRYEPDAAFYRYVRLSMLALLVMQLTFLAIGIFLGCAMKRYKMAGSVAVSVLLGTYFLSVISGLSKNLKFLDYVSPFRYFDAGVMLRESRLDVTSLVLSAAIILISMTAAYLTYARRDLYL